MKMTLLEMTQNVLSALDSDEVNSIFDTVESQQVAAVIKETYEEQFGTIEVPEFRSVVKLVGLGDLTKPNYLKFPTYVSSIDWIKYRDTHNNNRFKEVTYYKPEEFFEKVLQNTTASNYVSLVTDPSGVQYYIKTNEAPSVWTSLDDNLIAFDSYDSNYDSTLQASKTFAWGQVEPTFQLQDDFIPFLDSTFFPLLLAEAKSTCFINFKQISSSKEEQRARRQRIRMQHKKYRTRAQEYKSYEGPDFSRKA